MEQFLAFSLREIPYVAVTLMIAFTVHEFAHAYMAYKFGDSTAKNQGRLTLNPMQHLDPIGTILIFIAGFGWARPVPVNRFFFKNPRLAGISVSIAGPISNLVMAVLGFFIWYALAGTGLAASFPAFVADFLNIFIQLNLVLFVFNLLPFPPLDGYRIIEDLAPAHIRPKMTRFEAYGSVIFLILVITPLDQYTIQPIFNTVLPVLASGLNDFFYELFMT
ncbi:MULTISPECIES: site-2 protease family protein [Bacillales]|uniref:Site-2 protease family protein n=1 Tax=Cytobacillus firmus TaxID=1399 RepID=A0AA46Q156_CYTFI|nr:MULTISPECIES: site-2 protease family protein [Bacillales]KML42109.1 zinc metalloprotease [Cytobacillus firmus]MBG9446388.1 zinc metalloprotease [Cytobacillus firmus]MBG9451929.1 zinc metalloprotease [Cytobacillus firmus]MBG9588105.1 zinc metalloprotease [Cytobacillus firmus]MBY6054281.1 site-2 protease family protein [Cytobacillus firmus]